MTTRVFLRTVAVAVWCFSFLSFGHAWSPPTRDLARTATTTNVKTESSRRSFVASVGIIATTGSLLISSGGVPAVAAAAEESSFSSIAERAAQISKSLPSDEDDENDVSKPSVTTSSAIKADTRTAYDFSLPMAGKQTPFSDIVRRSGLVSDDGTTSSSSSSLKAILVVNIKQDDPVARKNIPELIALAAKYGRAGEFAVVVSPTDQGYYEPDTSALIRLKLASEYGYGINPATVVTDKVNLLGTGAHPFWRWLEGNCRTPSGLGKIQGNFEKFLIDGQTGRPLRRYPRKYMPSDMSDDISALLQDKPLPPPRANFKEQWRSEANDAERDTYRFQKGLNVFDQ